jgi:transmembrane sensor
VRETTDKQKAIAKAASEWLAAQSLGMLDAHDRRAFQAWLAQDGEHVAIYRNMAEMWKDRSITRALEDLNTDRQSTQCYRRRLFPSIVAMFKSPIYYAGAVATAVLVVTLVINVFYTVRTSETSPSGALTTPSGKIRDITLADGSVVTLGARSWITVDMTDEIRHVSLLAGEAFFDVKRDPKRPFVVDVGEARVEVLGTRFEVSLAPGGVQVSVAEGRVELVQIATEKLADQKSIHPVERRTILKKGEKAIAKPKEPIQEVTPVDIDVPGAWRDGRLIYQNARLDEVIADAQRYYSGRIVLASPELGELRVTATFGSDDIIAMIQLLSEQMPVDAEWRRNGDIVLLVAHRQ